MEEKKEKEEKEEKKIIYHTFFFPFSWELGEKNKDLFSIEKIKNHFREAEPIWENADFKDDSAFNENAGMDFKSFYDTRQYFYPSVRKAIYGFSNDDIVCNFRYRADDIKKGNSTYTIKHKNYYYELSVHSIDIRIYNTGIAILQITCENTDYLDINSVKKINGYGRRILVPYLGDPEGHSEKNMPYCEVTADSLDLRITEEIDFKEDFRKISTPISKRGMGSGIEIYPDISKDINRISETILGILNDGSETPFFSTNSASKAPCIIRPTLDDRMFVTCAIPTSVLELESKYGIPEEELYRVFGKDLTSDEAKISCYELLFVDEDGCTCQSKEMRENLLNQHLYRRWEDYGTILGITRQGMHCITSFPPTITCMNSQYKELCMLVLAQKASLVNFQNLITQTAEQITKDKKGMDYSSINRFLKLHEFFIRFQGQLNHHEATYEEQGIELYDLLRDSFGIEKHNESISGQMEAMSNDANNNLENSFNKGAAIIASFAILVSILPGVSLNSCWNTGISIFVAVVCVIIIWNFIKY